MKKLCGFLLTICLALFLVIFVAASAHRKVSSRLNLAEITIQQYDIAINSLETFFRLQADVNKALEKENDFLGKSNFILMDDIRGYKARAKVLEGRILKLVSAYRIREVELLEEIKRLKEELHLLSAVAPTLPPPEDYMETRLKPAFPVPKGTHGGWVHPPHTETDDGQHNQSEARTRVAHPERPDRLSEDTGMGCGSDARECFSTRHPRLVPLQKGVRRKMGRR